MRYGIERQCLCHSEWSLDSNDQSSGDNKMSGGSHIANNHRGLRQVAMLPAALFLCMASSGAWAAEIDSVQVDSANQKIIVKGGGFGPSTSITIGGVSVSSGYVSSSQLEIPFDPDGASAMMWRGSYKLVADGAVEFSVYVKAPIVAAPPPPPPPPPPPGGACPCESEWYDYGTLSSPNGFAGLGPSCVQESRSGDFVTVQFYDEISPIRTNYWVLWTEWLPSEGSGYCELWQDGPYRTLNSEDQFAACAAYLKDGFDWTGDNEFCF